VFEDGFKKVSNDEPVQLQNNGLENDPTRRFVVKHPLTVFWYGVVVFLINIVMLLTCLLKKFY
jgi:hypothetical protein